MQVANYNLFILIRLDDHTFILYVLRSIIPENGRIFAKMKNWKSLPQLLVAYLELA